VLLAVCKGTDWDCGCIPRIASGLGGGVGRHGEVCGALTGGVLIVGLAHGRDRAEEQEAKGAVHAKAGEFVTRFAEVNGALRCRDLIGLDVSSEDGIREYYARNLLEETCSGIVSNAVRVILELLDEWGAGQG
jgi:C_GCAxxG_C_C family probable redox protein